MLKSIMYRFLLICTFILSFVIIITRTERRILNGKLAKDKSYTVYLLKRDESPRQYDEWLCGGSIVSPHYIVTAAACVEDVEYMYAIAGYSKYVHSDKLNEDKCTSKYKKKIVYVCLPSAYEFDFPDVQKWAWVDIAVAKVESPYDFNDQGYLAVCTYIPKQIEINYDKKYQEPGIDAVTLGWGHQKEFRQTNDTRDLNNENLLGASVQIAEKERCKAIYGNKYPKILQLIDKYMICTIDKGNLDPKGDLIERTDPSDFKDGCEPKGTLRGTGLCKEDKVDPNDDLFIARRNNSIVNGTVQITRRNVGGICQNDHGGPLVTWIGSHEVLIGVNSVFRLNATTHECVGPFLFTSTWCSSAFLHCVIELNATDPGNHTRRRNVCDKALNAQGLSLVERTVSWTHHPDGPAENEKEDEREDEREEDLQIRPQIPLNSMYGKKP